MAALVDEERVDDGKAMLANAIAGRQLARFGTTP